MLNKKLGKIKKIKINDNEIVLSRSIIIPFYMAIASIILTFVVISLEIFLVTHNIISEELFNNSFVKICAGLLILMVSSFVFGVSKTPYKIRFNLTTRQIENLNINSNIIDILNFDEHEIQIISDNKIHSIQFFTPNNALALNLDVSSNDSISQETIKFITNNFKAKETQIDTTVTYDCIHCGYKQFVDFEYCPKCGKNDDGNTKNI